MSCCPRAPVQTIENGGTRMRIIGLDIHRAFAEAVAWKDGRLSRLGRVIMRREALEEFAALTAEEHHAVDSARSFDPVLPASGSVWLQGPCLALRADPARR